LDSLSVGRRDSDMAGDSERVAQLLDNICLVAAQQTQRGFVLTITCVVTPGKLRDAREVMELCF
jgi:hypothetical protein